MVARIEGDAAPKTLWTSLDFLGLGADAGVRGAALAALEKFTVGSCGPRGFYGTTSAHLELEAALADFFGVAEAITYSDATATIASVIPAFAKRGDVLLMDGGAAWGAQQGARLSRSKVVWWEHNDVRDLEAKLAAVRAADERSNKGRAESSAQRRFIFVEGVYATTGALCPLPAVVALAKEYKWRVILDDTLGFGVLGAAGRGAAEHWGVAPGDVHVTVGALSTTLGSVGGFCVGPRDVVDHQRLSGAGYCFSASAPPYLCAAAAAALAALRAAPRRVADLRARAEALHARAAAAGLGASLRLVSAPESPVKYWVLAGDGGAAAAAAAPASPAAARMLSPTSQRLPERSDAAARARAREEATLDEFVRRAAAAGVLLARTHALPGEPFPARPALKAAVTLRHTEADAERLVEVLREVAEGVI